MYHCHRKAKFALDIKTSKTHFLINSDTVFGDKQIHLCSAKVPKAHELTTNLWGFFASRQHRSHSLWPWSPTWIESSHSNTFSKQNPQNHEKFQPKKVSLILTFYWCRKSFATSWSSFSRIYRGAQDIRGWRRRRKRRPSKKRLLQESERPCQSQRWLQLPTKRLFQIGPQNSQHSQW